MDLPFTLHGAPGVVSATVGATTDPAALGASPGAAGLVHCQATVEHPARGYAALTGWIQLVRSTDDASGGTRFAMDPLMFVGEVPHPFAFFGVMPTLFDAPARRSRADLDWLAHSFLARIADIDGDVRVVEPITGFGWGFTVAGGSATVRPAHPLAAEAWDGQLELLHAEHPGWRFRAGTW
jgi:hypothetical protein